MGNGAKTINDEREQRLTRARHCAGALAAMIAAADADEVNEVIAEALSDFAESELKALPTNPDARAIAEKIIQEFPMVGWREDELLQIFSAELAQIQENAE